jgi:hypothetical protein
MKQELEIEQLRQHDKEATDLTIDQTVQIGRLRAALLRISSQALTRTEMQAIARAALGEN